MYSNIYRYLLLNLYLNTCYTFLFCFFYGGIDIIQMLLDRSVMMLKENHETLKGCRLFFTFVCVCARATYHTP